MEFLCLRETLRQKTDIERRVPFTYVWKFTVAVHGSPKKQQDTTQLIKDLLEKLRQPLDYEGPVKKESFGTADKTKELTYKISKDITHNVMKTMMANKDVFEVQLLGELHEKKWMLEQSNENGSSTKWLFKQEI